ncbi:hypothetical protein GPECTOR_11g237 [Gonium pectorale]|uniref:glutamine--tRNA ligase n=1 Tax=Gonium pectorale TaxID=33097 RepID=A0A150GPS2_GONPE|nr:hypothetical protein GPECTOR_11g237 [Gonium pectorale]|eukprot:KXZ51794.1 hypothetical protein GPECTOR_11g237 [Gonium pectorale]
MASKEEQDAASMALFLGIGLEETVAKNALKNPKFTKVLEEVIHEAGAASGCPKAKGNLLYTVASKFPANALSHRPMLLGYVMCEHMKSNAQLDGAFEYLRKVGSTEVDKKALEESAGVGVVVTQEQILAAVAAEVEANKEKLLAERVRRNELGASSVTQEQILAAVAAEVEANKEKLLAERYRVNLNVLLGGVTRKLKWADGAAVRSALEAAVEALLGPKTEADLAPPEPKKKVKAPAQPAAPKEEKPKEDEPSAPAPPDDPYAFLPKPDENNVVHTTVNFSDGRIMRIANTPEALASHLARTGGKVVTRFPPEPNGYLHIGHAKAMFVDFGMARQYDGVCYLRYDDTNPEAEKMEYITHIQEIARWMGWEPWKITYSSDYFQQLYDLAVELIKSGHAYVCHQTKAEIEVSRDKRLPSPWRDRPIEESLRLFDDMRRGLVEEGKATLRMKMDYKNENYNMFDMIAYRIKFVPHPHAGDKWCIYPSYDYTHCIVDSLEDITHSLCTLEFETRRASYYWLLDVLGMYKPVVWEYSRLNITNNVMSKRRLNKLVMGGFVNGWDDPRLLTLAGLRRRGVPPTAVNAFCRDIGITRNENLVPLHRLEHHVRAELDATSPRALAVLRPLKVVITNMPEGHFEEVEAKTFPGRDGSESYKVPLTQVVYIEATDFRLKDEKDYYGLAPGKSVLLRYAYPITCTSYTQDPATGAITELAATYDPDYYTAGHKPPKGVLNWVSQPAPGQDPPTFEARLYEPLFKSEDPGNMDAWLEDLNPDSLQKLSGCVMTARLAEAKVGDRFQFERLGYFAVDTDSAPGALVFNRTVTLKESKESKSLKK